MTQICRVAAVHAAPEFLDTGRTVDKICQLITEAGNQEVDLLVFPEVFLPGFPYWINCYPPIIQVGMHIRYGTASVKIPGPEIDRISEAANKAGVNIVLGVSEQDGGTLYNTQVFISETGTLIGRHRKLQPTFAERSIWGQGDGSTLSTFDTKIGRVGGLVCWEHTMNLARHALIGQGEQIHAGSWPALSTLVGFEDSFNSQVEAMSRNHAISGQCFVIVAMSPVTQQMIDIMEKELGPQGFLKAGGGWSAVIHPMTPYLAGPHEGLEEKIISADIDLDDIAALKVFVDATGHYSRRELLHLVVDADQKQAVEFKGRKGSESSESQIMLEEPQAAIVPNNPK